MQRLNLNYISIKYIEKRFQVLLNLIVLKLHFLSRLTLLTN